MPPQAYALVATFAACSVGLGWVSVRLVARLAGGPRRPAAYVLPVLAAFAAFYLIGHRLGIHVGPVIDLYGFGVALLGDVAIGFLSALITAFLQAWVVGVRRRPQPP
jgi:hypothetical protein